MLDQFFTPSKFGADVRAYFANSTANVAGFQKWNKPRGISMVQMIAIAGGGGGGGGFTRAAAAAGGGGGGGACSGITRFLCPAMFLPDSLFIQVGDGGQGGAASANGSNGLNSYILTSPTAVLPNIVCYSGANAPGGGGAGGTAAAGTAGTVPTIAVTQPINALGEWFSTVGLVGSAGGAQTGAVGTSVTAWAALSLSPGAGGGGCTTTDFDGGAQTVTALLDIGSQSYYPTGAGNIAKAGTGIVAAINGSSFHPRMTPFFNAGGAGGGTNNAGTAGNGGHGGYGCGGGGGGAGTTGGRGGNGGNGLVLIISW
jgi:hypothetical protein